MTGGLIAPDMAIMGGSLSFSGVKSINIHDDSRPLHIKLSYTKHVLEVLNQYIALSE